MLNLIRFCLPFMICDQEAVVRRLCHQEMAAVVWAGSLEISPWASLPSEAFRPTGVGRMISAKATQTEHLETN